MPDTPSERDDNAALLLNIQRLVQEVQQLDPVVAIGELSIVTTLADVGCLVGNLLLDPNILVPALPRILDLASHTDPQVRADAITVLTGFLRLMSDESRTDLTLKPIEAISRAIGDTEPNVQRTARSGMDILLSKEGCIYGPEILARSIVCNDQWGADVEYVFTNCRSSTGHEFVASLGLLVEMQQMDPVIAKRLFEMVRIVSHLTEQDPPADRKKFLSALNDICEAVCERLSHPEMVILPGFRKRHPTRTPTSRQLWHISS